MRAPLSWLREYVELPAVDARVIADRLVAAGLEVESVDTVGHDVHGVVVGQVLEIEELTGFKKPIRYCQIDVGEEVPRGIVCGATNFAVGDKVPVVLPGAVLPGGFEIAARKTYDHISDGMICSVRELGIGDDHGGIMVLAADTPVGADFVELAGMRDEVLDISLTPDRGYAASIRGIARDLSIVFDVAFHDPAHVPLPSADGPGYPASIGDPTACDRFVLREIRDFDPAARTPLTMMVRLARAGMRPVSLAVDITNYLMLELGQPLHAFDATKLTGEIVVRRAAAGERLETLDHVVRELHPDDILITDETGPISMAGTMGGLTTEIDDDSTAIVIEAAHFSPMGTARMSRRHRLHSEASYRFERGVDAELPLYASAKAVRLFAELGGAAVSNGVTDVSAPVADTTITMRADHPDRVAGTVYGRDTVVRRLTQLGCSVAGADPLTVTPPSWRPDLTAPNDLAEEVIRLEGYENIPSRAPRAVAGRGLTSVQRFRRRVGRALAAAGHAEVLNYPFQATGDADALTLPADDGRRQALRLVNPLTEEEPLLRTTLLPGLFRTLTRNIGRGFPDVGLFEIGLVYRPRTDTIAMPRPPVTRRPTDEELAAMAAALPDQPMRLAAVLAGEREPSGWWGDGRPADWADAIEVARIVAREAGVTLEVTADRHAPWHPGRCALLSVDGRLVGHAGELHPRVIKAYDLPPRSCAMELDLDRIPLAGPVPAPRVSTYPVATQDVALTVDRDVPAAVIEAALVAGIEQHGAADLLETVRLFDLYTGEQVGEGKKSLAYTLRFRAADRTLTAEETTRLRDAAVAAATARTGAVLRS
jgi:phenylalanyl-tRNA synthetase beta chain